jgi:acyl-CoA thioester hydrolase
MDNDAYGHLNNVVHYSIFDTAVNGWLMDNGAIDPFAGDGQIALVAETGCRYHAQMAYPDVVTAGLRVARIGTSSVRYEIGLFRNDEDTASAEGFFVHVHVNRVSRKPEPVAERTRILLAGIVARQKDNIARFP